MAIYNAVVTLMRDLEQLLSSYSYIFGSKQEFYPFTKEEIQILYHNVSLMDSLLRDSSGESYNRQLMSHDPILEMMFHRVVERARNSIDFWVVEGLRKFPCTRVMLVRYLAKLTGDKANAYSLLERICTLSEITEHIVTIKDKRKEKIHVEREVQDLEVTSSPGKSILMTRKQISGSSTVNYIKALVIEELQNYPGASVSRVCSADRSPIPSPLRTPDTLNLLGLDEDLVSMLGGLTLNEISEEIVSIKEDLQKMLDGRKAQDLEVNPPPGKFNLFIQEQSFSPCD